MLRPTYSQKDKSAVQRMIATTLTPENNQNRASQEHQEHQEHQAHQEHQEHQEYQEYPEHQEYPIITNSQGKPSEIWLSLSELEDEVHFTSSPEPSHLPSSSPPIAPNRRKMTAVKQLQSSDENSSPLSQSILIEANSSSEPEANKLNKNDDTVKPIPLGNSVNNLNESQYTETKSVSGALPSKRKMTSNISSTQNETKPGIKKLFQASICSFLQGPSTSDNTVTYTEGTQENGKFKMMLSAEQEKVVETVIKLKRNVFFTGSAGTGKSVLLREIIQRLRRKFKDNQSAIAVTASTGLAACNIGGITLHSFAGIGYGDAPVDILLKKIKKNRKATFRWLYTKVLIIDEVSMISAELFDKLEELARLIRKSDRPFGGIQLIICGDFFQLPPVNPNSNDMKFCFESESWTNAIHSNIRLTKVFRQKDQSFVDMLNQLRMGRLTRESIQEFCMMSRPLNCSDGILPTQLYSTREEVDRANRSHMIRLKETSRYFTAYDVCKIQDELIRNNLFSNFILPEKLELKLNCQVMLVRNFDDQLVNGSVGKVIAFMDNKTYKASTKNVLDETHVEILPEHTFADTGEVTIVSNPESQKTAQWPLVRFTIAGGGYRDLLCQPETFSVEANGEIIASRSQVPLILAYAISIHKAQGQTLQRAIVDLNRIFENGQAYVALSRAVSREGLQVLNFNPSKVKCHPRVVRFYEQLVEL